MDGKFDAAVIGAGISGLCAAYWLEKHGCNVTVFEKSLHIGGTIITEKQDGFLMDLGPNSALETSHILRDLIHELGIEEDKVYGSEISNNRYIVKCGKLHALPMSPPRFLKSRLFSTKAKLRLAKEPFIKKTRAEDISLADFVRYRLGKEFLDYAINPFVAGVFAGDPEDLSTPAAFPKLYALEQKYGSLIRGAIKGRSERKKSQKETSKDRAKLFSFINGMETFPIALSKHLQGRIMLNAEVLKIRKNDLFHLDILSKGEIVEREFSHVVISTPSAAVAEIIRGLSPEEAGAIGKIHYPPVAVVFMGFKNEQVKRPLDGFGFLVPKVEKLQILGSIWSSSLFPGRAPEGSAAFTTFIGGTRQPQNVDFDDNQLAKMAYDDLDRLVGLEGIPEFIRIKRWPRAIPQYTMGYRKIQEMFDSLETEFPGLYFAGNWRRGISIGDSVLGSFETVQKLLGRRGDT